MLKNYFLENAIKMKYYIVLEDSKNAICQISLANVVALLEKIEKEEKERERQERNVLTGKSLFEMLEQIFPTFDKG
jgi:hypothetical protein